MAKLITLKSMGGKDGVLSVFEHLLPEKIERVYFIYGVPGESIRGGHRHHKTWQGLICLNGSCKIYIQESNELDYSVVLDSPSKCLVLRPEDWHQMYEFSEGSILLVLANQDYDPADYIDEAYDPAKIIK